MQVQEIMTKDPVCCTTGTTLENVVDLMVEHDCGALPVVDDPEKRRVVGIVTDRDIACRNVARGRNPLDFKARHCMTVNVVTATPETGLEDCCKIMAQNQIRRLPVVDAEDRCVGIVSLADIALHAPPSVTAEVVRVISQPCATASHVPPPLPLGMAPRRARIGAAEPLLSGARAIIDLEWQGWIASPHQLPDQAGIFCVWAAPVQAGEDRTHYISDADAELLYVGEAVNIAERVASHEERPCWLEKRGRPDDRVVFTYALLPPDDVNEGWRQVIKSCLVSTHRPPCNQESFEYEQEPAVTVWNSGLTFGKLRASHTCVGSTAPTQ